MTVTTKYNLGDRVRIKEISCHGIVESISWDSLGEQYKVAYWFNGERKTCWVFTSELEP